MYYDYFNLAVLLLAGVLMVYAGMTVLSLLRPNNPSDLKLSTYECGEEAFGSSWIRFDMRFYTVALIFMLFDLEIAFLFPWASVFGHPDYPGIQNVVMLEGVIFIGILALGLIYVWAKGDLDWIKAFSEGRAVMTGATPTDFSERRRALSEADPTTRSTSHPTTHPTTDPTMQGDSTRASEPAAAPGGGTASAETTSGTGGGES